MAAQVNLRSISFPERPPIELRYPDLEKVKHQEINIPAPVVKPTPIVAPPPPMSAPPSTSRLSPYVPFVDDFTGEKWITLPNGNMIFVTDKTPTRYQRSEISDEEIECIMRGGPDI